MSLIQEEEAVNKMASWDRFAHPQEVSEPFLACPGRDHLPPWALPSQADFNSTLHRIVPHCPLIVEC